MHEWSLGLGDPLALTLAADFRLCTPDFVNDHIWELEIGGGDPPALSVRTTYGLRARSMRLFPRFTHENLIVSDPAAFLLQPRIRRFFPNFLLLDYCPIPGFDVLAEYWVPDLHCIAGRFTVTNRTGKSSTILLELCAQLVPFEGESLATFSRYSVNFLAGRSADLSPVVFLTGGPTPGPGPYSSLALDLDLDSGSSRTLTWAQAALAKPEESLELVRLTAARPWEAERARIELINTAQTIDIISGDPDWDAAFAFSQKTAFSLFFNPSRHLSYPSFVIARQPDHGYSPRGDGGDYPHLWNGQPTLEACTFSSLLPGAPELAAGLLHNFLATQNQEGAVDWKPGLAGQRGRWLATPLLANFAWQIYQQTRDLNFLRQVRPGLEAFIRCWLTDSHDRDGDGFPEWDHPLHTGLEDNPAFTVWQAGGQGARISLTESPALAALLFRESKALVNIAEALNLPESLANWERYSRRLRLQVEECWNPEAVLYHLRDRDTHLSPSGTLLGSQNGTGTLSLVQTFQQPVRLIVRLELKGQSTRRAEITLRGQKGDAPQTERFERMDYQWGADVAVATTSMVYTGISEIEVAGLENIDRVSVHVMDCTSEDLTLFLPLSAGIPSMSRAFEMVNHTLLAENRFGGQFGIPVCKILPNPAHDPDHPLSSRELIGSEKSAVSSKAEPSLFTHADMVATREAVHLPWNVLIVEGLLNYGLLEEATLLTSRLMSAVIQNLKRQHAFSSAYCSGNGEGIGERNAVQGLAPLGLFLKVLGVRIESPERVRINGINPFPWSVTVKYRGLTVNRNANQTRIVFPSGETISLDDPTDAVITTK